jgi:hypothetical protein
MVYWNVLGTEGNFISHYNVISSETKICDLKQKQKKHNSRGWSYEAIRQSGEARSE